MKLKRCEKHDINYFFYCFMCVYEYKKKEVKIKMELHQKFEKWHPKNLVDLLNFIKERYPIKFKVIIYDYDEMLMGN